MMLYHCPMELPSPASLSRSSFTREVVKALLPVVRGDVIDFGAGMSRYKAWIMERAKTYTTLDISPFPGIDIVADVLNPPVADASFDTVLSTHVIEHVKEPWVMAGHIARVLRPGGFSIVMAPFMYPFHADPYDFFRFSEQGLRSLFERAGLEVLLCAKYGSWLDIQSETLKQKFFSPYKRPHPWWKRRLFGLIETILGALNRLFKPGICYTNVVCVARKPN